MLGLINKVLGRDNQLEDDAERVYRTLMDQSRNAGFYGADRVPDTFQGRAELLLLHVSIVMKACLAHGEQGKLLQDAIFQRMRDDFDVALREEGYSDAGVKHRIKPLMKLFYQIVQQFFAALDQPGNAELIDAFSGAEKAEGLGKVGARYQGELATYARRFWDRASEMSLGELASADFAFPGVPS